MSRHAGAIQALAVKGVIGAIKEPIAALTSVSNLLGVKAIKQLEGHPEYTAVYELLQVSCTYLRSRVWHPSTLTCLSGSSFTCSSLPQIFSFKKLKDLVEYNAANPTVLPKYSIDLDKAMRDMRLLSLSLLAHDFEEIPYDAIAETLQIPKVRLTFEAHNSQRVGTRELKVIARLSGQDEVETWVVHAITAKLIEAKMNQQQVRRMIGIDAMSGVGGS